MAEILDYLQVSLNFTTSLARPPDGGWGARDDQGNWSGMVGMVKRNEVDFALGGFCSLVARLDILYVRFVGAVSCLIRFTQPNSPRGRQPQQQQN